jgi:hypothetical protein
MNKVHKYDMMFDFGDRRKDNSYENEKLLLEEMKKLIGVDDNDLMIKNEGWIKNKIRQYKLNIIENG